MKMPFAIEEVMFAPCGMNCMVCYKHCSTKKTCIGCLQNDMGKPEHCRHCKIKDCTKIKGYTYCYECSDFPCKQIKSLEKNYRLRYNTSLIQNSEEVREHGLGLFMEKQRDRYTCLQCGGVISLHDAECSECKIQEK